MDTPILDFLEAYRASKTARLHMPGHKGQPYLGFESFDITEVKGADSLYEANGIIHSSEANATALFGTARTLFSTEGSSQCVRAMLYLALSARKPNTPPLFLAARNVHKSFVYGVALLDAQVQWLPSVQATSLCSCPITPDWLEHALKALPAPPAGVYVTSPDYLGGMADIEALSLICHRYGTLLLVDNAHGAYLRFLPVSRHPMDLGADLCCDSAHKTLPVLTGGAYLHISRTAPAGMADMAKHALALFGSTSPSYLILASLDRCNRYLAEEAPHRLQTMAEKLHTLRGNLTQAGWHIPPSDPIRLTVEAPDGLTGQEMGEMLRKVGAECEYADPHHLVMMFSPDNSQEDLDRVAHGLGKNNLPYTPHLPLTSTAGEQAVSIRQAVFAPQKTVPVSEAVGRICASPVVACPPAIPIVISGERISPQAVAVMEQYGIDEINIVT